MWRLNVEILPFGIIETPLTCRASGRRPYRAMPTLCRSCAMLNSSTKYARLRSDSCCYSAAKMWQSDRLTRRSTVWLVSAASNSYGPRFGYVTPAAIRQHLHWLLRRVRGRHPQIATFSLYMLCAKLRTATDPQHMRLEMNFETSTLHSLVRRLSDIKVLAICYSQAFTCF